MGGRTDREELSQTLDDAENERKQIIVQVRILARGRLLLRYPDCRMQIPPPGKILHVDSRRLHTLVQGVGTPVVILEAGIAASSISWALVQPKVAEFTTVASLRPRRFQLERGESEPALASWIATAWKWFVRVCSISWGRPHSRTGETR